MHNRGTVFHACLACLCCISSMFRWWLCFRYIRLIRGRSACVQLGIEVNHWQTHRPTVDSSLINTGVKVKVITFHITTVWTRPCASEILHHRSSVHVHGRLAMQLRSPCKDRAYLIYRRNRLFKYSMPTLPTCFNCIVPGGDLNR